MMLPMFETPVVILVLVGVAGYLLGSIPFGMVVARMMGLGNLRDIGSGNIGATNVLRTGNKLAAFLTLVLDSGKGAIAVLIAAWMFVCRQCSQMPTFKKSSTKCCLQTLPWARW